MSMFLEVIDLPMLAKNVRIIDIAFPRFARIRFTILDITHTNIFRYQTFQLLQH